MDATTQAGLFPQTLHGANWNGIELDLREFGDLDSSSSYGLVLERLKTLCSQIHDGVASNDIKKLAVFGFARIPALIELGARLDDKVSTAIFQRHRVDHGNAWSWPTTDSSLELATKQIQVGTNKSRVALMVSLSGYIDLKDTQRFLDDSYSIYEIQPTSGLTHPGVIQSSADLAMFEKELRQFLGRVEEEHGKIDEVMLFPAVGVAPAVTIGRVLMPQISPAWIVYDRDQDGDFFMALRVDS